MSNSYIWESGGVAAEESAETVYSPQEYGDLVVSYPPALPQIQMRRKYREWEFLDLLGGGMPAWKRGVDIIGAILALVIFSPVLTLVALAIKCTSRGPVFFRQQRAGFHCRPFTFYKFRSMCDNAEVMQKSLRQYNERGGPAFKMTNDPRVTPLGRFLRKWSIDELPQLFNVLIGDISLVGPRPLPVHENDGCDCWHRNRLDIHPGITCLWQITARDRSDFDSWMRLDIEYARKRSPALDLKILLLTIPAVLSRKGAV